MSAHRSDAFPCCPSAFLLIINITYRRPKTGGYKACSRKFTINTSLPFQVFFSSKPEKDIELTFQPNKTAGVPPALTISHLYVDVSNNATQGTHIIPVRADIVIIPSFSLDNPDFTTSVPLKAISNFTINVLPPLEFKDYFNNFIGVWIKPVNTLWRYLPE